MSWKLCATSVEGTAHSSRGISCQDSSKAFRISTSKGSYFVLIAADGCGSSLHSDIGSELVSTEVSDCLSYWISRADATPILSELIIFAFGHASQMLSRKADELSISVRDLASTCLCVVIGPSSYAAAQIGDGVIVRRANGVAGCMFWPSQEYANVTHTLSDQNWMYKVQAYDSLLHDDSASGWFLATDGIQNIACDSTRKIPHVGFVSALIDKFASIPVTMEDFLQNALKQFLSSDRVGTAVSDDMTIVLACR